MKVVKEYINEKFVKDSDPIQDMGIGFGHWLDDVQSELSKYLMEDDDINNLEDAEEYINVAYNELEKLYQKALSAKEAAKIVYDDPKIYKQWQRNKFNWPQQEPSDDLRANCRAWQNMEGSLIDAEEIARYLIDRHPDYPEEELRQMAYDWVGYEEKDKELEESLNEKFTEFGDPVEDMGIGVINKLMKATEGCYSRQVGYYPEDEWKRIVEWLLEQYEPWEVLAILDNKIMRWAYDARVKDYPATLEDFQNYNTRYHDANDEKNFKTDVILNSYRKSYPHYVEDYQDKAKELGLFRESLHEKFTQESDPVKDLGIGLYHLRNFKSSEEYANFMVKHLAAILGKKEIPKDFLYGGGFYFNPKYYKKMDSFSNRYIRIKYRGIWNEDNMMLHRTLQKMGYKVK